MYFQNFYFNLASTHWITQDGHVLFLTRNKEIWFEIVNGNRKNTYESVQHDIKKHEAIIYNSKTEMYYRLDPTSISYSDSISGQYMPLYKGSWIDLESKIFS